MKVLAEIVWDLKWIQVTDVLCLHKDHIRIKCLSHAG